MRILLHEARQIFYVVDWSFRQDAVAEIKDVAGTSGGELQNVFGTGFQFFPIGKQ